VAVIIFLLAISPPVLPRPASVSGNKRYHRGRRPDRGLRTRNQDLANIRGFTGGHGECPNASFSFSASFSFMKRFSDFLVWFVVRQFGIKKPLNVFQRLWIIVQAMMDY
jgi:hypothetical protein